MTYPYASTDSSVLSFINGQNSGPDERGSGGTYAPAVLNNGIAGTSTDNVVGFSQLTSSGSSVIALGSGFNAVVIDGANSATAAAGSDNFSFTVDSSGLVTLTDSTTGATQQVSGVSFLLFNGAAAGATSGSYASMFFIGGANQTEVTELYNASFGRQPDLGGVEYYANQIKAGLSFLDIAGEFMASPEFQNRYGTNVSDAQFVANLYQNVLHRTPAQSELSYYTAALANQEAGSVVNSTNPVQWSRGQELLNFTTSHENQQDVAGFVINTAGAVTNGFVYSTASSGSETATQVLTSAQSSGVLDTSLINPSSVTAPVTVGANTIGTVGSGSGAGSFAVSSTSASGEFILSSSFNHFSDPSTTATITVVGSPTGGSYVGMASGTVEFGGNGNTIATGSTASETLVAVTGFNSTDSLLLYGFGRGLSTTVVAPSASAPLQGSSINFTNGNTPSYVINVGGVGTGSAAEVATAANKVYIPSGQSLEWAVFFGQTNSGSTVLFDWHSPSGAGSADSNGNHIVDASEFTGGVMLVGISSTAISASTFHS